MPVCQDAYLLSALSTISPFWFTQYPLHVQEGAFQGEPGMDPHLTDLMRLRNRESSVVTHKSAQYEFPCNEYEDPDTTRCRVDI